MCASLCAMLMRKNTFFTMVLSRSPAMCPGSAPGGGQQAVALECTHAARVVNIEQALCRDHFADLLQAATWRAVLDLVNAQTARFFPFSYR